MRDGQHVVVSRRNAVFRIGTEFTSPDKGRLSVVTTVDSPTLHLPPVTTRTTGTFDSMWAGIHFSSTDSAFTAAGDELDFRRGVFTGKQFLRLFLPRR